MLTFAGCAAFAAPYTASTAPDAAARAVLSTALNRVYDGAPLHTDPAPTIHRNFPQIIEQNFARLDSARSAALIDGLNTKELNSLARNYNNAINDTGRAASLPAVLAYRLDAPRLARLADHFGYAPLYSAIIRVAPEKAYQFDQLANRAVQPAMGVRTAQGVGAYLFYSPEEIYLDFRTMPVGSLGAAGAVYETGALMGTAVSVSFAAGWATGTGLSWVMSEYTPSLWETLGGTLSEMVQRLQDANDDLKRGEVEKTFGDLFSLSYEVSTTIQSLGGDNFVCIAWPTWYNAQAAKVNKSNQ